ncbi:MAG: exodeoxyribonuclease VII small subunit [Thermodesulfobacterium geofontis]|uniref:Exodeoxyribonuclease 7 small subunit n=1 Tax=Thermodesulfobacterium geofontis TaxID=1295609 RepID=A0A2N7PLV8_9BACT|nr:MAG: exodeoxyribonuclease VII small subunit [Thermodesulfobacterium geofontis]PMP93269.1 MAG: exodeoxyribonuclease VII small subunit [Thermodesulfobacterium geofontis]
MIKNETLSFESALKRIEQILKQLENKELDLEEAINLYEEGLRLIHFCEEKLKNARTRIEVILKDKEGFKLESLEKAYELLKNGGK